MMSCWSDKLLLKKLKTYFVIESTVLGVKQISQQYLFLLQKVKKKKKFMPISKNVLQKYCFKCKKTKQHKIAFLKIYLQTCNFY